MQTSNVTNLTQHKSWFVGSLAISVFIALPMAVVIFSLFSPSDTIWAHIRSNLLPEYIFNTLVLMIQVSVYTTIIGVSTAWLTAATEFPGRKLLSWLLVLPMAASAYIVAYIYTDLLDYSGPIQSSLRALTGLSGSYYFPQIRSLSGAAIILSLVLYPYVYLLVRVAFLRRSTTLFNAARTLGAAPTRAFWHIALPAARPALVGGLALVLMETLADFGVVDYFGVPTFSTGIFRTWFAFGEKMAAMKLAAVMLIFVIIVLWLEKHSRRQIEHQSLASDYNALRLQPKPALARLATLFCCLPVLFGALIPVAVLSYYAWTVGDPLWGSEFQTFAMNSVYVAAITTTIAVAIALYLTYSNYLLNNRANQAAIQIATIGYALPGAMLAVGLLTPISSVDRWLTASFETWFGWQGGLLLTGTISVLVYAYVIRFLTVAHSSVSSGLTQIPPIYSDVARSLGATTARVVSKIHVPLMANSIFVAAILVFIDTIRELPATLMLRPFNFETLTTRVYRLASDERIAEASTASLLIVLLGLIPVLLLTRFTESRAN